MLIQLQKFRSNTRCHLIYYTKKYPQWLLILPYAHTPFTPISLAFLHRSGKFTRLWPYIGSTGIPLCYNKEHGSTASTTFSAFFCISVKYALSLASQNVSNGWSFLEFILRLLFHFIIHVSILFIYFDEYFLKVRYGFNCGSVTSPIPA